MKKIILILLSLLMIFTFLSCDGDPPEEPGNLCLITYDKNIANIISTIKFPVWTFLASFVCVVAQLLSEKNWHNSCIEETAEFILYSLILALILIYKKQ